jgi:hypothetical protein
VTPPLGFCGCGVCGTEPDVVVDVVVVVDDGAVEGLELVAGFAASGTWKGTAIFD